MTMQPATNLPPVPLTPAVTSLPRPILVAVAPSVYMQPVLTSPVVNSPEVLLTPAVTSLLRSTLVAVTSAVNMQPVSTFPNRW